ncbi:MAG: HAMP domain-containing sensor histidine kinase [Myxococcales bacterium]
MRLPLAWLCDATLLLLEKPPSARADRGWQLLLARSEPARQPAVVEVGDLALDSLASTPVERALRTGRPQLVDPDSPAHWPSQLSRLEFRSSLTLPLAAPRRTLGALVLFSREPGAGGSERVDLASELAHRCAVALENATLYWQSQAAVRARDEFIAVASHELKTPLTPLLLQIQSLLRALDRGDLAAERRAQFGRMLRSSEARIKALLGLVGRLLDSARAAGEWLRLARRDVDLASVVRGAVEAQRSQLAAAHCDLVTDVPDGIVGHWDPQRLGQALSCVLENAIKFAPGRPIEIRAQQRGGWARLTVRDHGPGIPRAEQRRVFEPFERAASYLRVGGMGLGLHIARQIVDAHDGSIRLESSPGKGATFIIELPRVPGGRASEADRPQLS